MSGHIYKNKTSKSSPTFARDFAEVAEKNGYLIANVPHMNMAETFRAHGALVQDGFDLHMIQLCKPDKASVSLQFNPERSVLMPKFVMAFGDGEHTQIRFHHYSQENIAALVNCEKFPQSLAATYSQIISMIEEAV